MPNHFLEVLSLENRILEFWGRKPLTELANVSGVHRNTLTAYAKGVDPKLTNADAIAKALDKSVYDVWPTLKSMR